MARLFSYSSYSANSTNKVYAPSFRTAENLGATTSLVQWRYPALFSTGNLFARVRFHAYGRSNGLVPTDPGNTTATLATTGVDRDSRSESGVLAGRPGVVFELADSRGVLAPGDDIEISIDVSSGDANFNALRIIWQDEPF